MKENLKVWTTTVAATGIDVLNVQAFFLSNHDSIDTGKVSNVILLKLLLLQPAITREKCQVRASHRGSSVPLKNVMTCSLQSALEFTLFI